MQKRETHKDVEISGKRYRINKFDALTGSYFSYMVMTHILPTIMKSGKDLQLADVSGGIATAGKTMSKEEFIAFQKDCLSVCQQVRDIGGTEGLLNVLLADGTWGVPDLSHDTMTVMALTLHSIFFNVQGFFGEGGDKNPLMDSFKDLSLFNLKA